MKTLPSPRACAMALGPALAFFALNASAELENRDLLDGILQKYSDAASSWAGVITDAAAWLFWTLALISMVWTFGMLALRKADIGEFFSELFKFTMFTGFFWWILINGPRFAVSIMDSMRQLGGKATGLGGGLSPSNVVDIGFGIFAKVVDQSSTLAPVDSAVGIVIAAIILVVLALVAVNMLILLIAGWILAYAGVFFLGFGGSRWTSEMAIQYFKTVMSIAAQLFAMVLIVGIANTFLADYYARMSAGPVLLKDMGVMLIVAVILLAIVNKVPPMIGGLAGGVHVLGNGMGAGSVGAAMGAAGATVAAASAAVATAGAALAAGGANAAGGASALVAAVRLAGEHTDSGSDVVSRMIRNSGSGSGSSAESSWAARMGATGVDGRSADSGGRQSQEADAGNFGGGGIASRLIRDSNGAVVGARPSAKLGSGQSDSAKIAGKKSGGTLGTVGRVAVDAAANLAMGGADVVAAKVGELAEAARDRIGETFGGQVAAAIRKRGEAERGEPLFDGDSLAATGFVAPDAGRDEKTVDAEAEIAPFRDHRVF